MARLLGHGAMTTAQGIAEIPRAIAREAGLRRQLEGKPVRTPADNRAAYQSLHSEGDLAVYTGQVNILSFLRKAF